MASLIQPALESVSITLLLLGGLIAAASLVFTRRERRSDRVAAIFLRWFLLCSVGLRFFIHFVAQSFYGSVAAHHIGWAPSPFQFELGMASLGFALVGFVAAFGGLGLRLAAVLGPATLVWGAAIGQVLLLQPGQDHAQAQAHLGAMSGADVFIPLVGFALLIWQAKAQNRRSVFARSRL